MKKVYTFGKIDYNNNGRKTHLVDIEMELEEKEGKPRFSASGNVWNTTHSDIVMGGQCIDDVWNEYHLQLKNRALYKEIMELWKKWHLNNMQAGCVHQRMAKWEDKLINPELPKTQDNMRMWKTYRNAKGQFTNGLLARPCGKCGYKYGTSWLYEPIEEKDLIRIKELIV